MFQVFKDNIKNWNLKTFFDTVNKIIGVYFNDCDYCTEKKPVPFTESAF